MFNSTNHFAAITERNYRLLYGQVIKIFSVFLFAVQQAVFNYSYDPHMCMYVAAVGLERPRIFALRVITQLPGAAQYLLWLYSPTREIQSRLERKHAKTLLTPIASCCFLFFEHASLQRKHPLLPGGTPPLLR